MTGPPNRRALLRAGGLALAGLAGCVGDSGSGTADDSPPESTASETTTAEPQTETTGGTSLDLDPRSVQSSFFYLTTPDSMDVEAVEGRQFLFVAASPSGEWPRPGALELVADGERYRGTTGPGSVSAYQLYEQGRVYDPEEERAGWVAFEVPNPLDAESVALEYENRRRALAEAYRTALAAPPAAFELVSFDAPERVEPDETFEVSLAVENVGEGDGTFRASLNESGPAYVPHQVELSVPAGERAEWSETFGSRIYEGTERATYRLRSAVADRDREVAVVSETSG